MAWLLIETPDGQRRQYKLGELDSGFGRAKANAVPLADQKCSSFHCLIKPQRAGRYAVVDAGSRNGTRVNEEQLAEGEERLLEEGDTISLGQTNIRYSEAAPVTDLDTQRILNPEETAAAIAAGESVVEPPLVPSQIASASETDSSATAEMSSGGTPSFTAGIADTRSQTQTELSAVTVPAAARPHLEATVAVVEAPNATLEPDASTTSVLAADHAKAGGRTALAPQGRDNQQQHHQHHPPLRSLIMLTVAVALVSVAAFAAGSRHASGVLFGESVNDADGAANNPTQHDGTLPALDSASLAQELAELRRQHRTTQRLLARLDERQATQQAEHAILVDELAEHVAALQQSVIRQDELNSTEIEEELLQIHRLLVNLHDHLDLDHGLDLDREPESEEPNNGTTTATHPTTRD